MRVGFVGVGRMGAPMCARVVGGGYAVRAFDTRPEALDAAVAAGAERAASAADCAAAADVLITVLPAAGHVEEVLLGAGGALAALPRGALAIDMSTSSPRLGRRIAEAAAQHDVGFIDAPVADAAKAEEGGLRIFAGGSDEDVVRARPVLETMGHVEHVGPGGTGYAVKLLVNLQWFMHAAATAEALVIGRRAGIELRTLHTALATGPARSSFLENEALEVLEEGDYGERFPLALVTEELQMAIELADDAGIPAELSARTRDLYMQVLDRYGGGAGEMAVMRHYEDLAGEPLRLDGDDG